MSKKEGREGEKLDVYVKDLKKDMDKRLSEPQSAD